MEPTYWIAIAMIVAFILLGLFYGYLRSELPQRRDDDDARPKKKGQK